MLFNSLEFLAFFAIFYCVYLALFRAHKVQNLWLLVGSYLFYGWWDWRFLGLLLVSTVIDYAVGRRLHVTEDAPAATPASSDED